MIVIKTIKFEKATGKPVRKTIYCTTGVSLGMAEIRHDKEHNDLSVYTPISIIDVFDTNED